MTNPSLFPPTPDVKRLIEAVRKVGVPVSVIEIEPARIRIFSNPHSQPEKMNAYEEWVLSEKRR